VLQSVTQTKWDQTKAQLKEALAMIASSLDGLVSYKQLEEIRGFLGYMSMTYLMVTPYLKGFHLTLASHHPGCDKFGWKMPLKEWAAYLHEAVEGGKLSDEEAKAMAEAVLEPTNP
jgi:hypothetical protein